MTDATDRRYTILLDGMVGTELEAEASDLGLEPHDHMSGILTAHVLPRLKKKVPDLAERLEAAVRVKAEASRSEGIEELAEKIHEHHAYIEEQGTLAERRRRNLMNEVLALAGARLRRRLEEQVREDESVQELLDEVVARRLDPASAAAKLLEREL